MMRPCWNSLWRWLRGPADDPGYRAGSLAIAGSAVYRDGTGTARHDAPPQSDEEMRAMARSTRKATALQLFNPAQPVEDRRQLLGRDEELAQLTRAMLDLGMHALVHGARGAGKTSLARAFGDHADERGHIVLYASCSEDIDFAALVDPYLDELAEALPRDLAAALREGRRAAGERLGPRELCALLARIGDHRVVMIVDEFDRVEDKATRAAVATLLKLLSDARLPVRLLVVGIARDMAGLIDAHASLRRHMVAVGLRPFDEAGAADLFARGEEAIGIAFPTEARAHIASLAAGSPYHLRLFCYTTVLAAIECDELSIGPAALEVGLRDAFTLWAGGNPAAASVFERLARRGAAQRERLRGVAIAALAAEQSGGPSCSSDATDPETSALLAPLLRCVGEDGACAFEDSLAPQFLLVACRLAATEAAPVRDAPRVAVPPLHALREVRP